MAKTTLGPVDELLPLPGPAFQMLLALGEGERHGYALKREILQRTGGKMSVGSGALYVFDAVNKQLGLRIEMRKRMMPVILIDRMEEKPTDN